MSGAADMPRYRVKRVKQGEETALTGEYDGALWDVYAISASGRADLHICRCRSYDMAHIVADKLGLAAYVTAHTPIEELRSMPYLVKDSPEEGTE